MEEHATNLIELLVNNKKKKRSDDTNKDLRIKLFETLNVLIDENSQYEDNDLKKLLIDFFNLYISINTHIVKHHGTINDVRNIVDTMIDNIISKTETIKNEEVTKVINLVKDKKEKMEFINIEKIT